MSEREDPPARPSTSLDALILHTMGGASERWLDQVLSGLLCRVIAGVCRAHGRMCSDGVLACSAAAVAAQSHPVRRRRQERVRGCLDEFKTERDAANAEERRVSAGAE